MQSYLKFTTPRAITTWLLFFFNLNIFNIKYKSVKMPNQLGGHKMYLIKTSSQQLDFLLIASGSYQGISASMQCQCLSSYFHQAVQLTGAKMPLFLSHLKPVLIHLLKPTLSLSYLKLPIAESE